MNEVMKHLDRLTPESGCLKSASESGTMGGGQGECRAGQLSLLLRESMRTLVQLEFRTKELSRLAVWLTSPKTLVLGLGRLSEEIKILHARLEDEFGGEGVTDGYRPQG